MKERPILFNAPMVRALLSGSKTQTRRRFKLPPGLDWYFSGALRGEETGDVHDPAGKGWWNIDELRCPYGQPGDQLWVKETWREDSPDDPEGAIYRADQEHLMPQGGRWKPSIFMPRWASRVTLEITGVRVERLQDISETDALAEGIHRYDVLEEAGPHDPHFNRGTYQRLWESINGGGSWASNPWVWVITFKGIAP